MDKRGKKMNGSNNRSNSKGHVLFLPFPAQGHINPILQFAKRLSSKGFKTTLATTVYLHKTIHLRDCNVEIKTISDGYDETGPSGAENGEIYVTTLKEVGSRSLEDLIKKNNSNSFNTTEDYELITGLVCDAILPWGLDVGKQLGLLTASFYTQPCGVSSIFYHVKQGHLNVPYKEPTLSLPGLPLLASQDLPSSVLILEQPYPTALHLLLSQFENLQKADWLLFNSFSDLENEVLKWMRQLGRVRTIGPTTPSMYLDKRVEGDKENSLNLFKPSDDTNYLKWLDEKETGSVLYISFGSIAELEQEQMNELFWGIKQSDRDVLWVVREKEHSKLLNKFDEILDKGLVVSWCSQLEVLAHDSVGCFMTHCGWNSTMEALSLGVPMVAMPNIWDQFTNAKFVEDVWGVGIRVKKNDQEIVTRDEVEFCIREVMGGERGKVIKMNANKWRELAKTAIDEGGSSDLNIDEFAASVAYS